MKERWKGKKARGRNHRPKQKNILQIFEAYHKFQVGLFWINSLKKRVSQDGQEKRQDQIMWLTKNWGWMQYTHLFFPLSCLGRMRRKVAAAASRGGREVRAPVRLYSSRATVALKHSAGRHTKTKEAAKVL